MDYGSSANNDSLVYAQWEAIHNPAIIGKVFQSDEDGALRNNSALIIEMLDSIKHSFARGDDLMVFSDYKPGINWGKILLYNNSIEITIQTNVSNGENVVDPGNYEFGEKSNAMGRDGDFVTIGYYGAPNPNLIEITIDADYKDELERYLYSEYDGCVVFSKTTINEEAEDVEEEVTEVYGISSACNIGVREAVLAITDDNLLFPTTCATSYLSEETECGEITTPGLAKNIHNDLLNGNLSKFKYIPKVYDARFASRADSIPDFDKIHDLTDHGVIVVGTRLPPSDIGHVVLVVPGEMENTTVYGINIDLPMILDTGEGVNYSSAVANIRWQNAVVLTNWYKYVGE